MNLISNYTSLNIVYIHGLGGSILNGEKFKYFKGIYPNIIGFQWEQTDDLNKKITAFIQNHINPKLQTLIIGSSAGGKITLLMKKLIINHTGTFPLTCLLNPLANINYKLIDLQLENEYLLTAELHKDNIESLIIWSPQDEVINQNESIQQFNFNNWFVQVNDDHALRKSMHIVVKRIDEYVYQNYNVI